MFKTAGKVIKCRAAVAWGPKQPLSIENIEVAPPKSHEIRIKIIASGVCHTDANIINDSNPTVFPVILGHEGAGIIESIGDNVKNFKPGDHVIPLYMPQCGKCKYCKNPKTNLCELFLSIQEKGIMHDGTTRFSCNGKTVYHFMGTSTFSEYTVVADISICKINEKAPLNKVCLLGCAIPTGYGAALNNAKVEPGSICGVWGLGAIGLAAVMGCRKAGASKIYGIDINPRKFDLAKKFGCTDFVNPNDYEGERIQDVLIKMTNGGFDYTFECIGNVNTMRAALESCEMGWGTSVVIGLSPAKQVTSIIPYYLLLGRTWKGTAFGGWNAAQDVPKLVEEYLNKELMVDEFITHTMGLDKINEAFDLMLKGESLRSVIEF